MLSWARERCCNVACRFGGTISSEFSTRNPELARRIRGGLYGLLVGDALGVPYEFKSPSELPPLSEIEMAPPPGFDRTYGLPDGTWSDDGAQALCLLASLVESGEWNIHDFGARLVAWHDEGYMAVGQHVFDVGITSAQSIRRLRSGVNATEAGASDEHSNGNGSLMRALPVALWALRHDLEDAEIIRIAREQSLVTHAHVRSQLCCALYCLWATRIGRGQEAESARDESVQVLAGGLNVDERIELETRILPDGLATGSGYVVDCLRSARVALGVGDFEAVGKQAVSFGNDTDTTACVACGLAGLRDGVDGIPILWVQALREKEMPGQVLAALLS